MSRARNQNLQQKSEPKPRLKKTGELAGTVDGVQYKAVNVTAQGRNNAKMKTFPGGGAVCRLCCDAVNVSAQNRNEATIEKIGKHVWASGNVEGVGRLIREIES